MRLKLLSVALVLSLLIGVPATVSAQTIQATGQIIVVTAKVESKIFVVVDGAGRIIQIFSNSDERVEPTFVLNSINGSSVPITTDLRLPYDAIMSESPVSYGTLYERGQPIAPQLSILMGHPAATISAWPSR